MMMASHHRISMVRVGILCNYRFMPWFKPWHKPAGGWVNQAYSRLSTTHGHITDCKLDSVVYAGVCVVIS